MENFKINPGVSFPIDKEPQIISPEITEYERSGNFIQSQEDFAKSISHPGDSISDLINKIQQYNEISETALAQGLQAPSIGPGYQIDLNKSIDRLQNAFNPDKPTLRASARPDVIGSLSDYERYAQSKDFQSFGYVPSLGSEQEYKYGRAMSWGDTMGKAFAGGGALAADTFVEGWKGWGRMAEALFTWDSSKLMGSKEERYEIAKKQEEIFNKYAIYGTAESQDSLLNRQFFGEMLQQSGFTIGALAQMISEQYLTFGLGKIFSGTIGAFSKARGFNTALNVSEFVNNTRKAQQVISNSERVTSTLKNLAKSIVPLYGDVNNLSKAYKAGAGTFQLSMLGLGGIKRELSMFNMARSEAIFEAASTYKDMEDRLVSDFYKENGREPNESELEKIRNTADKASSDNFVVNTGILMLMNRIQLGNMTKTFSAERKIFSEGMSSLGKDVFEVSGKVAGKTVKKVYEKGFFGSLGSTLDIAKTFGKKKAAWEFGKSLGKGLMKFEGSEGAQELLQEASNKGLSNYYYDLYNGKKGYGDRFDKIVESIDNPLTSFQGAKTFLMGALTGRLIAPVTYLGSKLDFSDAKKQREVKKSEAIKIINTFYADPSQYIKEQIANVKVQNKAAENMEEAVKNQDRYTFHNNRDSAFAKGVASAIQLNLYDSFKDSLKEFANELTPEEFNKTFNIQSTEASKNSVNQFVNKITSQMDEYFTLYNNLKDKYSDNIIPELYKNNKPEEYELVKKAKLAQHAAIEMLTTNVFRARQSTKRAVELTSEMAANPNIGGSATQLITKLGSEKAIKDTIKELFRDIALIKNNEEITSEQKVLLKDKMQELELALRWKDDFESILSADEESYNPSIQERAYNSYKSLIEHYNKISKKDVAISREDIDDNFLRMVDYVLLNRDSKDFIDAMNVLADPYNLNTIYNAIVSAADLFGGTMQSQHIDEVNSIFDEKKENKSEEIETDKSEIEAKKAEEKLKEIWNSIGNGPGRNALEDGWAESFSYIDETLSVGGENYQAHGMGKSGFAYAIRDLFELFRNGVDPNRGGGRLYTAPLAVSKENKAAASATGTSGGTAYADGAFILVAKKGILGISNVNDIGGILVNSGLTDINPEILTELRKAFPNLVIESYKNAKGLVEQLNQKAELDTLETSTSDEINNVEKSYTDYLNDISKETSIDKLLDLYRFFDNNGAKNISNKEKNDIVSKIYDRIELLEKKGSVKLKASSLEFINKYNEALVDIKKSLSKKSFDDLTEEDVDKAFSVLKPVLELISFEDAKPYINRHTDEKNELKQKIRQNKQMSDEDKLKLSISSLFNKSKSIKEIVDESFNIINALALKDLKNTLIDHFNEEYIKYINKIIPLLKSNLNKSGSSTIKQSLYNNASIFNETVRKNMEKYEKKAQVLAEATKNIVLTVDYDTNWSNPIDRDIQNRSYDKEITINQIRALRNLYQAKLITEDELNQTLNYSSLQMASELINVAVARSYTLRLNKLVNEFIKTGKSEKLEEQLVKYRNENGEKDAVKNTKLDLVDIKDLGDDIDLILSVLNVPKTQVLSDEQQKLLDDYINTIYALQFDASLESILDELLKHKTEVTSGQKAFSFDDIFSNTFNNVFSKLIKYEKDVDVAAEVKQELYNAFLKYQTLTNVDEGKKILDEIVSNYGLPKKLDISRRVFSAILSHALELQSDNLDEQQTDSVELTEDDVVAILDNPKQSLSSQDIDKVESIAKDQLLKKIISKLNIAIGNKKENAEYNPDLLSYEQEGAAIYYSALRPKDASDLRNEDQLRKELNVQEGKTSLKNALSFIINSDFATDAEKELAKKFIDIVSDEDQILIDNSLDVAGQYDLESKSIFINLAAVDGSKNDSSPLETVILHELIHKFTDSALSDKQSGYYSKIKSLYNAVENNSSAKTFYAFSDKLTEEEKLFEFVSEAFTNPAFQYMLAKTPFANSKKSVWQKFVEVVNSILKSIGITIEDNVLNEVINLTTGLITPEELKEDIKEEQLDDYLFDEEIVLNNIKDAKNIKDLDNIRKDLRRRIKNGSIKSFFVKSLKATLARKYKSFKPNEASKLYVKGKDISVDGRTYRFYKTSDSFLIMYNSKNGVRIVRSAKIKEDIINAIIKKTGSYKSILDDANIEYIKDTLLNNDDLKLYGDSLDSVAEIKYPKVINEPVSLKFRSEADYKAFLKEYKALVKKGTNNPGYFKELDSLEKKYGSTAVKNFTELFYKYGSFPNITKLINAKAFSVTGNMIQAYEELMYDLGDDAYQLDEYHRAIINDDMIGLPYAKYVKQDIKKGLSKYFGFVISDDLQSKIEDEIINSEFEDIPPPPVPTPTPDLIVDPIQAYSTVSPDQLDDPTAYDFVNVTPEDSRSAKEPYALRSKPIDLDFNGNPNQQYIQYYHKVRNIINILSLKNIQDLNNVYITLSKDNINLRWDGTGQDSDIASKITQFNGVVGYLSDELGNPLVFNSDADVIGTIDKDNLSDHKNMNNGSNQIVYFVTTTDKSKGNNELDKNSLEKLLDARSKALNNIRQIAKLKEVRQGHFNTKVLVKPSDIKQNRADTRNDDFYKQITQSNISFKLSDSGKALIGVITAKDGAINLFSLFPVNTREVRYKIYTDSTSYDDVSSFDHLMDLLKTYNELYIADPNNPDLQDIDKKLLNFVRNFWFTSPNTLKIGKNASGLYQNIGIKTHYKKVFLIENDKVLPGNADEIKMVKEYINNTPVNLSKKWITEEEKFFLPYTVVENGKKTIKFVEKNYIDFLLREVGMKGNTTSIPSQNNLERYNSTIHFYNPTDLDTKIISSVPSEEDLIKSEDSVKKSINDALDNVSDDKLSTKAPVSPKKKNRFRSAPKLQDIYKKTCK